MKVYLKDGSTKCICIFIHVEVQGTRDSHFMERIFVYFYRIFDKYREQGSEVISLGILTDEDQNYRPDEYCFSRWGFEHRLKIPIVKIIDFKNKEEFRKKLETSTNPMTLVVKAQLKSLEAKKGEKRGERNEKLETARRMLSDDIPIDRIIKYTGLTEEEIKGLVN